MRKLTAIDYLINTLPEESWAHTIAALRQDPCVWHQLETLDFLQLAISKLGKTPDLWTPLNLALVALIPRFEIKDWNAQHLQLYPELKEKGEQLFQEYRNFPDMELTLSQSGLLAIYYFHNPEKITEDIPNTTCACIYPLVSDKLAYLSQIGFRKAAHVLLMHPGWLEHDPERLPSLISSYDYPQRANALRYFTQFWPDLVARWAVVAMSTPRLDASTSPIQHEEGELVQTIFSSIYQVELFQLSNQSSGLQSKLQESLHGIELLRNKLSLRLIKTLLLQENFERAQQIWMGNRSRFDIKQVADLIVFMTDKGLGVFVPNWVEEECASKLASSNHPVCLLAAGVYHANQDRKSPALQLINKAMENSDSPDLLDCPHRLIAARIFSQLGKYLSSIQEIEKVLKIYPNQYNALELLLENFEKTKEYVRAIDIARVLVILDPGATDIRHKLANNLKRNQQWADALQEYETIIAKQDKPQTEELHLLAECSNFADQPQQAASVCQQLLLVDPEDYEAHRILGEAYLALGDPLKAHQQFEQAINISPASVQSWLALANLAEHREDLEKSKEILLAASQANPNCPEIQLALGKILSSQNALTKSLAMFHAAKTSIEDIEGEQDERLYADILQNLGITQLLLGHQEDAHRTLEYAYGLFPTEIGVTQTYAKCLLEVNYPEDARQLLSRLRDQVPNNASVHFDYANACLIVQQDYTGAEESLLACIDLDPKNLQAKALLAETYEALGDYTQAYRIYKDVVNSNLYTNPTWQTRLSLGMGRVALVLNDPGTAIAILKNVLIGNGEDLQVLQALSTAYQAAEINDHALNVAKTALNLFPDNQENVNWFVSQTIKLEVAEEGAEILNQLLETKPQDSYLLTRLGQIYIHQNSLELATATFNKIKMLESVRVEDLSVAAQCLLDINQPEDAIACLDRAISLTQNSDDNHLLPRLLFTKSLAQKEKGELDEALSTIDEAETGAHLIPEIIDLKTRILFYQGKNDDSQRCIELGIDLFPNHVGLRLLAITLYRILDEPATAMLHADNFFINPEQENLSNIDIVTAAVVADLLVSMLQSERAKDLLNRNDFAGDNNSLDTLPFHCLKGELALLAGEEVAAADALTWATRIDSEHPRVLALRSLISIRQGDFETAKSIFNQALKSINEYPYLNEQSQKTIPPTPYQFNYAASTFLALADAALVMQEWSVTQYLLQRAMQIIPGEPRPHFCYARAKVLRAEFQRLCECLNIVTHAPGESSTAEFAYRQFEESILKSAQLIMPQSSLSKRKGFGVREPKSIISVWLARGQAVFRPSLEHAQAIGKIDFAPDLKAVHLASLRLCGAQKLAINIANNYLAEVEQIPVDATLLAQIALTLIDDAPQQALFCIQKAIDINLWQKSMQLPPIYSIQALIAQKVDDRELETEALQSALEVWPDEPRWLSTIADILLVGNQDDFTQAVAYLKQAISLAPKWIEPAIKLANAHRETGNTQEAIHVLEYATQNNGDQPVLWLSLAQLYYLDHNNPQAIRCAKNAISIDPNLVDAHFLMAEVSLSVENPDMALKYTDEILAIQPDNLRALLINYRALKDLDRGEAALSALEKILPHMPDAITLHLERIDLITEIQGIDQALSAIRSLSSNHPSDTEILTAQAEILAKSGDSEAAIHLAQEIINSKDYQIGKSDIGSLLLLLGRLSRKSGQLDQAIYHLTEAIRTTPDYPDSYMELGRCYQDRRQYDLALQNYQDAIALQPDNAKYYYMAGMVLKECKDFENAEIMFKRASNLAPTDLNIHRQLGAVTAINIVTNHPDPSTITIHN